MLCIHRVKPLIQAKEPMLLDIIGLDAVIYLRFLRMCRTMCVGNARCSHAQTMS